MAKNDPSLVYACRVDTQTHICSQAAARLRPMRWILTALVACYVGMAAYAIGRWLGNDDLASAGEWLTVPLTLLYLVPLALLLVMGPAAFVLRLVERWRGRRSR